MKYSQFRIALLTFILGVISVSFVSALYDKWGEPYIELPQVKSDTPIIVVYETAHHHYNQTDTGAGGGGSGGQTCEEFIKSLGKLTKQSRRILAYTPCRNSISK